MGEDVSLENSVHLHWKHSMSGIGNPRMHPMIYIIYYKCTIIMNFIYIIYLILKCSVFDAALELYWHLAESMQYFKY